MGERRAVASAGVEKHKRLGGAFQAMNRPADRRRTRW
jgi:hypothetical protein